MKKFILIPVLSVLFVISVPPEEAKGSDGPSRVAAVCLRAENTIETAEFYCELLGLSEFPLQQDDRIRLRLDGAVIFILKGKPCVAESDVPFPLFALTVGDLDKAEVFLKARNLKIPYGIEGSRQRRELQFYDPAGNLVELVQNR